MIRGSRVINYGYALLRNITIMIDRTKLSQCNPSRVKIFVGVLNLANIFRILTNVFQRPSEELGISRGV
jgi:hypothetical protein